MFDKYFWDERIFLIFVVPYLNIGVMKEIEFMQVEPFEGKEGQYNHLYLSINRDENYEENYEEPNIIRVEDFERCHDPGIAVR